MNRISQRIQKRIALRAPSPTASPISQAKFTSRTAPIAQGLSPEQKRLLEELAELAGQINKLFHRATLRLMVLGMKEAFIGTDTKNSSVK